MTRGERHRCRRVEVWMRVRSFLTDARLVAVRTQIDVEGETPQDGRGCCSAATSPSSRERRLFSLLRRTANRNGNEDFSFPN